MNLNLKVNVLYFSMGLLALMHLRILNFLGVLLLLAFVLLTNMLEQNEFNRQEFKIDSLYEIEHFTVSNKNNKINCPEWLKFPDYERVVWINHSISLLWKFGLKESIERSVNLSLTKLVEEMKPKYMNKVKFRGVEFGNTSPVITGVKVHQTPKCPNCPRNATVDFCPSCGPNCVLDFTIVFSKGNPRINFSYKSKESFSINNIKLKAKARLKISDFVNALPGFSKLEFSVLSSPKINYSVSAFKISITAFPVLKKWLNKFLTEDIISGCLFPKSIPYELDSDAINFLRMAGKLKRSGINVTKRGILKLFIQKIKTRAFPRDETCAYCIIKTDKQRCVETAVFKTKNRKKEFVFNEHVFFYEVSSETLVQIFALNRAENGGTDEVLGQCCIKVGSRAKGGGLKSLPLFKGADSTAAVGSVHFELDYVPSKAKMAIGNTYEQKPPSKKKSITLKESISSIHKVTVEVFEARNMNLGGNVKNMDFTVFLHLGEFCLKTKTKSSTNRPKWEQTFQAELPFLSLKELKVSLFVSTSKIKPRIVGTACITFLDDDGLLLIEENDENDWYPIKDVDSQYAGKIKLGIDSKIINMAEKRKTFNAKNVTSLKEDVLKHKETEKKKKSKNTLITVDILQAKHLNLLEKSRKDLDTFVSLYVNDFAKKSTRTIEKCSSPHWCESFQYSLSSKEAKIHIKVFDKYSESTSFLLGCVSFKAADISTSSSDPFWLALAKPNSQTHKESLKNLPEKFIESDTHLKVKKDKKSGARRVSISNPFSSGKREPSLSREAKGLDSKTSMSDLSEAHSLADCYFPAEEEIVPKIRICVCNKMWKNVEHSSTLKKSIKPNSDNIQFLDLKRGSKFKKKMLTFTKAKSKSQSLSASNANLANKPFALATKRKLLKIAKKHVDLKIEEGCIVWNNRNGGGESHALLIDKKLVVSRKGDEEIHFAREDKNKTFFGEKSVISLLYNELQGHLRAYK